RESEFIPVAFGQQEARDVISAISTVKGSEFSHTPTISADNALTGRLKGVIPRTNPGQPGDEWVAMYVRGLHTSSANKLPIMMVDNVEREFSQLNLNEIESVTVLKDAAALAIYGGRGANGVIMITTKRGKNTPKQQLQLNMQSGIVQPVRLPSFLNSYEYAKLYNQAQLLDGYSESSLRFTPDQIEGYRKTVEGAPGADPYRYPNNNYYEEALRDFSWQQNYDISMRGGNNFARYFVLIGYLQQDGLYKYESETPKYSTNTGYQRFNFRSNLDFDVSKIIKGGLDMAGRLEFRHQPGNDATSILNSMAITPSLAYPIFNKDNSLGGTATYTRNIYGQINRSGYRETQRRIFNATAYISADLNDYLKGLSLTARAGIDFYNEYAIGRTIGSFAVSELLPDDGSGEDKYAVRGTDGTISSSNSPREKDRNLMLQLNANYKRTFNNDHNLDAVLNFDIIDAQIYNGAYRVIPDYTTVSLGGRLAYNYKHRYYAELSIGYSGTEVYAPESRFRAYPAAALGWTITEEDFLKDNPLLSFLKLRGSYGKVGLDRSGTRDRYGIPTDRFQFRESWSNVGVSGYYFGDPLASDAGSIELSAPNNLLHGETAYLSNIGLDAAFFNNRLSLSADYFTEQRKDIFYQRTLDYPGILGGSIPVENLLQVNSRGVEAGISYQDKLTKDFGMFAGLDFIWHANKLVKAYEAESFEWNTAEGRPLEQMKGYECIGFFTENDFENGKLKEGIPSQATFGTVRPGDLRYRDIYEDGVIDEKDRTFIGRSLTMPEAVANLNLGFTWKGFELSALIQGVVKNSTMMEQIYLPFTSGTGNATKYAFEAWTPETAASAKYPRLTTFASSSAYSNNYQSSDFWVMDGSYIRVKNIVLAYNLPEKILKNIGIQATKIYLSGYNLFTFDKVKDFDPEPEPYYAFYAYPNNRTISLGINITF
ncbi:MAG: TonB-dependent receptor, partial [Candidatus Symbiothrix sp.]|nr:TonB-dependent receptor [Candidatus Symbiothrix sp.]